MNKFVAEKVDTPRISLLLLGSVSFIVMADMRVIANDFNTTVGNTAAIISAYTIPYGLFQLVYGPLGDRIGKLRVMNTGITIFAVGTALCAFAPNLPLLILLRFLTGMFAATVIPLSLAYIGDNFPYTERQTAIGRYLSALMLGQILSSSLGGIFGEFLSWRNIFLLFGVVSMMVAVIFWQVTWKIPQEPSTQETKNFFATLKPYFQLLTKANARLVITTVFIEGFFLYGGFAYVGAFIRDRYNLPYIKHWYITEWFWDWWIALQYLGKMADSSLGGTRTSYSRWFLGGNLFFIHKFIPELDVVYSYNHFHWAWLLYDA
jgi:predicted MFS family arabinose efflux permease